MFNQSKKGNSLNQSVPHTQTTAHLSRARKKSTPCYCGVKIDLREVNLKINLERTELQGSYSVKIMLPGQVTI